MSEHLQISETKTWALYQHSSSPFFSLPSIPLDLKYSSTHTCKQRTYTRLHHSFPSLTRWRLNSFLLERAHALGVPVVRLSQPSPVRKSSPSSTVHCIYFYGCRPNTYYQAVILQVSSLGLAAIASTTRPLAL